MSNTKRRFTRVTRDRLLGRNVKFTCASTEEISAYEELAVAFLKRILGVDRKDCLITDESSLWDFHREESNKELFRKISEVYGVDVSDVKSGNLVEIFKRIGTADVGN